MRYLVVHRSSQRLDGHLSQVALGMTPYRDRPVGLFLFAQRFQYAQFVVPATFGIPLENVTIAQGVILLSCNASAGAKQAKQTTAIRQSEIIVFFFICFVLSHSEIIGAYLTLYL